MTPNVKGKGMKNGRLMLCIKRSESVELKMREQTSACSSRPMTNRIIAVVIIFSPLKVILTAKLSIGYAKFPHSQH